MQYGRRGFSLAMLAAATACASASAPPQPPPSATVPSAFDAQGFRTIRYRAPVDRAPAPARRIALAEALRLADRGEALFLDVLPAEGGVRDPATGHWRLASAHETIPGAQWHPEAGRAPVDPVLWRGLARAVAAARTARPRTTVVLLCRADCWMGWNAARRLARDGVPRVLWLAEGIDGWHGAGRALSPAQPVAVASDPAP